MTRRSLVQKLNYPLQSQLTPVIAMSVRVWGPECPPYAPLAFFSATLMR